VSQALHNARSEPATGAPASGRALVAACAGNLVEWYDFAVYGAFATVIAATFFPGSDPSARLLASFAVFATAFLVRPFGALLFGRLGDRVGRRPVLATVIVLMAAATAGIGLLPSYATIGMLAPLLLTLLRSAQGLSVGGESSGATAFVVEYAPRGPARLVRRLALVAIAAPFLGRLSDRVGRRPLLVAGTLALLVVTLPAFLLIRGAVPSGLPLGYVLVGLPLSCLVIVPPFLAELFPTPIRSTALAITYGVGSALFGGTAPFLATLLVRRTGNPVTPAFYAVAVAVVAVVAALLTRETAFRPLDTD